MLHLPYDLSECILQNGIFFPRGMPFIIYVEALQIVYLGLG